MPVDFVVVDFVTLGSLINSSLGEAPRNVACARGSTCFGLAEEEEDQDERDCDEDDGEDEEYEREREDEDEREREYEDDVDDQDEREREGPHKPPPREKLKPRLFMVWRSEEAPSQPPPREKPPCRRSAERLRDASSSSSSSSHASCQSSTPALLPPLTVTVRDVGSLSTPPPGTDSPAAEAMSATRATNSTTR